MAYVVRAAVLGGDGIVAEDEIVVLGAVVAAETVAKARIVNVIGIAGMAEREN